jgi:CheY-like chemotaxis protein
MPSILIVEDEPQIRSMLQETLELEGYTTAEAADGQEALREFRLNPADLIITDILMPEKEGLALISEMRKANPEVKIIAISGGAANLSPGCNLELARMFGAHRTFQKPLDIDALLQSITDLIGQGNAP